MSRIFRYLRWLPLAIFLVGCVPTLSPSPSEPSINDKIGHLVTELTQTDSHLGDKKVAVAELTTPLGEKTALTAFLTDKLIDRMVNAGGLHLVERGRLKTVMKELDFTLTGYVDEHSEKLLGKMLGADGLITGTVTELEESFLVTVRMTATETAEIISSAEVELVKERKIKNWPVAISQTLNPLCQYK